MARSRATLAPLALILLAASAVLLFFVVLAGTTRVTPFSRTYFLSADTSSIAGARPISQWTFFRICGASNRGCSHAWPDPPVGWAWSRNPTGTNLPARLIGSYGGGTTSYSYFYMWRFGWVFYLLALFFTVVAFFTGFLACFGRLGSALAGMMSTVALLFLTIAASLMTATFVRMRDQFNAVGRSAKLGVWAFGFTWGAVGGLLIATALFWIGIRNRDPVSSTGMRWGRRRSVRSRRSYDLGTHRVKEDYA
ncbi:SUR7/PalI family-domain-containing protein [Nemania sp. FL0916]|nr:SUR7/PalI family-domain-containing protein [Nemania sp. FL0916]